MRELWKAASVVSTRTYCLNSATKSCSEHYNGQTDASDNRQLRYIQKQKIASLYGISYCTQQSLQAPHRLTTRQMTNVNRILLARRSYTTSVSNYSVA